MEELDVDNMNEIKDKHEIGTPEDHLSEIMEEAEKYHPGYGASVMTGDVLIHALEIKTTSFCTLRCKDCTHLIPYTKAPAHMPAEDLMDDIKKIIRVAKVAGLIFMGGEVMIYPQLAELMEAYSKEGFYDRVGFVRVTTNGTVVPSDEFCAAFRKIKNGYVVISDYGILSSNRDEAAKKLESFGIKVNVIPEDLQWRSLGDWHHRDYSKEEAEELYRKCHGKLYLHLYRDHLYHCYRAPVMNEDGLIPHSDGDYLDIGSMSVEDLSRRLPEFLTGLSCTKSCFYCDGFHEQSPFVERAAQL